MTSDYGAATQLEKIDMLDFADIIALNKFDKRGALDALRDVRKQYQRNHNLWESNVDDMPVFGSIASQFNDPGVNRLFNELMLKLFPKELESSEIKGQSEKQYIIPPARVRYLSEITDAIRKYDEETSKQSEIARQIYCLDSLLSLIFLLICPSLHLLAVSSFFLPFVVILIFHKTLSHSIEPSQCLLL